MARRSDSAGGSGPRWLDDEQLAAWRRLIAVTMLLPYELDAQLQRDSSLTHFEYLILVHLSARRADGLRMSRLATLANASQSRTSHVIARMERRGLVERTRSEGDARGSLATITDEGFATIADAAPGHVEAVRTYVFDALTPTQVRQLAKITGAILDRLDPDGTRTGLRDF